MHDPIRAADAAAAAAGMCAALADAMQAPRALFEIVCRDADGNERWRETVANLITTAGKTHVADTYLKGAAYTAAWYLILAGSGTKAAADTLASHAGWSEVTAYAGSRPAVTWGSTSAGSNTASAIVVTFNGIYTVAGCGLCTVASGTAGTLYNIADFATARSGGSGDTLTITPTLSWS